MPVTVPSTPEGLQELMDNKAQMKEIFADKVTMKNFFTAYAEAFVKSNSDTTTDLRDQVQSVLFDMVRSNGGGRKSPVDLANAISFRGGKPQLALSGTPAVSHGHGTVYNKAAIGAEFERAYPESEDRFASIGEYCQAIRAEAAPGTHRNRVELLHKLEVVRSFTNSFSSEEPGAGGFLIPEIMRSELLQLALETAIVRSRATVFPMSTLRVPIPTVDDTSHVSSLFGGVTFYWAEESASLIESQATFGKVVLDAKKLTGFFKVPNELLQDAPAFSTFFDTNIPKALAFSEDVAFMTETGAGTPAGFINCPASVQVAKESGQSANTIVWENVVGMYQRMLPTSLGSAVWIAAIDTFKELMTMALSVGTGGGPVMIGGLQQPGSEMPPMSILGRPVIFTEKVPQLGTTGDINFVDLSYYLIGDRQSVQVSASEHYLFQNDQIAYRIIERVDGRPWLQSPLTPHNGSSNTLSPFVQLATRS